MKSNKKPINKKITRWILVIIISLIIVSAPIIYLFYSIFKPIIDLNNGDKSSIEEWYNSLSYDEIIDKRKDYLMNSKFDEIQNGAMHSLNSDLFKNIDGKVEGVSKVNIQSEDISINAVFDSNVNKIAPIYYEVQNKFPIVVNTDDNIESKIPLRIESENNIIENIFKILYKAYFEDFTEINTKNGINVEDISINNIYESDDSNIFFINYDLIIRDNNGEEVKCVAIITDYSYDNQNGVFGNLRVANADNKEDVYSDLLIYNCNDWEVKLYYKDNLDDRPKTSDFNISLPKEWISITLDDQ